MLMVTNENHSNHDLVAERVMLCVRCESVRVYVCMHVCTFPSPKQREEGLSMAFHEDSISGIPSVEFCRGSAE
jgi:hypothetical protein